ncbi:hypothetical protein M0P98_02180 [bacterium]|nr:hypothetical protein [bacterium]
MKIKFITSFLILVFLFFCSSLFPAGKTIYYTSDNLNVEFDESSEPYKFILSGNVKVVLDDINIICNEAIFNQSTGEINIEGVVDVETIEGTFRAESFFYNVYQEEGVMLNSTFKVPPLYGKAEKVERDKTTLFLYKGYITSCDKENPHYRLAVEKIKYVHKDYLKAEKMKLFLGEKFAVFYFPRITIDYKTKSSPFLISTGHTSRVGKTLEMIFNHRVSETSDISLATKVNIGTKSIGAGPEVVSEDKNFKLSAFLSYQFDKGEFEYGGFTELSKPFSLSSIPFNVIIDWRWMYDKDFFYDFFKDTYYNKSRTYNHIALTKNFESGIFHIGFRDSAGDDFLNIEKIPELRFYTPILKVPQTPIYLENDFRITNFYKDKEYTLRSVESLTLSTRNESGYFVFSPYISLAGVDYRNSEENRLNLLGEIGLKSSILLKREETDFVGYLNPSFSLLYRTAKYNKDKLEYFDRVENINNGLYAKTALDWSIWRYEKYPQIISFENLYNITNKDFEETTLKYDFKITKNISLLGDNQWDMVKGKYVFGANDMVVDYKDKQFSFGTRYDEQGDISGINAGFNHSVGSSWKYAINLCYDVNDASFNRRTIEIWKKLHCWELNMKIRKNDEDFSFYIFLSPIFL